MDRTGPYSLRIPPLANTDLETIPSANPKSDRSKEKVVISYLVKFAQTF